MICGTALLLKDTESCFKMHAEEIVVRDKRQNSMHIDYTTKLGHTIETFKANTTCQCKERFEVITESTMTNLNTSYSNEKKISRFVDGSNTRVNNSFSH